MYIGNVHTLPIEVEIPVHSCFIKKEKGYKRGKEIIMLLLYLTLLRLGT